MKIYGLATDFYKDLNKYLSNRENNFGLYDTFITILFYGLTEKVLNSYGKFPLFRGGVISAKEFENLKKGKFYSCKNFLSFSKSLLQADIYLKENLKVIKNNGSLFLTRFIIEKYEKIKEGKNYGYLISNAEMRHYSNFPKEKEVLFLPLSSFRIIDKDEDTFKGVKLKIIKLHYVGMMPK